MDSDLSLFQAVALIRVAATFWAIHYGYGQPLDSIPESHKGDVEKVRLRHWRHCCSGKFLTSVLTQALYGSQLCYVVSLGLTKMSTAFFIGHLSRYAPHFRISYILAAASGLWTVASTILIALRGNLSRPWATYDGSEALVGFIHIPSYLTLLSLNTPQYVRWIAIEAVGLVVEVALWGYSIDIVWGLQMKISKRILILCAFACRLLYIYPYLPSSSHHLTRDRLIPIIGIRLFYLSPS